MNRGYYTNTTRALSSKRLTAVDFHNNKLARQKSKTVNCEQFFGETNANAAELLE
jgi:hypothetical protein